MSVKDKAIELVNGFMPHVYCFMGSGMLSNTYDKDIAFMNAKKCATFAVDNVMWSLDNAIPTQGNKETYLEYWDRVKLEIEKLNIEEI
jgi:hypothetical protein